MLYADKETVAMRSRILGQIIVVPLVLPVAANAATVEAPGIETGISVTWIILGVLAVIFVLGSGWLVVRAISRHRERLRQSPKEPS